MHRNHEKGAPSFLNYCSYRAVSLISRIAPFAGLTLIVMSAPCTVAAKTFLAVVSTTLGYVNSIIYTLISVAVLLVAYGALKMITRAGNIKSKESGKQILWYGIIGLVIMFALWGIENILLNSLFSGTAGMPAIPQP